jgi:predicted ABC-type ATPase
MKNKSRVRIFAGPNGSGKSTMKTLIQDELLGFYINPDEIEKTLNINLSINFDEYKIKTNLENVKDFFQNSILLRKNNLMELIERISFLDNSLFIQKEFINSYIASVISDFIRKNLLHSTYSFSFETVMSSNDKIEILKNAQEKGYRTYLYFVATEDPAININRVSQRVRMGGHDVPKDKIISRYYRSLELLIEAVKYANRAYIFDNSSEKLRYVIEVEDFKTIKKGTDYEPLPFWVQKYFFDKVQNISSL